MQSLNLLYFSRVLWHQLGGTMDKDGEKLKKNLAAHLSHKHKVKGTWTHNPSNQSSVSLPLQPPQHSGPEDPLVPTRVNPLFLASDIHMPDHIISNSPPPFNNNATTEVFSDAPLGPFVESHLKRWPSSSSFKSAIDDPLTSIEPEKASTQGFQAEIIEENPMNEYQNPIGALNLNIIGEHTPPPGYTPKKEPAIKRLVKEVHRIWIAPAIAGMPAYLDGWWKSRQAKRACEARAKTKATGVGAAIQRLITRRLPLTPAQIYSARIVGGVFLALIASFFIYSFLEKRRRDHRVIIDVSQHNLDRGRVVTLIPKDRYLLEGARLTADDDERLVPTVDRPSSPTPPPVTYDYSPVPYEYPPARIPYRLKGGK